MRAVLPATSARARNAAGNRGFEKCGGQSVSWETSFKGLGVTARSGHGLFDQAGVQGPRPGQDVVVKVAAAVVQRVRSWPALPGPAHIGAGLGLSMKEILPPMLGVMFCQTRSGPPGLQPRLPQIAPRLLC